MEWLRGPNPAPSSPRPPVRGAPAGTTHDWGPIEAVLERVEWDLPTGWDPAHLPAVSRARRLLCAGAAALPVVVYRDGEPLTAGVPRVARRPDPSITRYEFVYRTIAAMLRGGAFWRLTGFDREGHPANAQVLPRSMVSVTRAEDDLLARSYTYDGQPAQLLGDSPRQAGLEVLAHIPHDLATEDAVDGDSVYDSPAMKLIEAAEQLAALFFEDGAPPTTVLKVPYDGDGKDAEELRQQWAESRRRSRIAVAFGGIEPDFPDATAAELELLGTRRHHVADVARLFGIPAPLLLVELEGSGMLNYTNTSGMFTDLVRATLGPEYLAPIAETWSDLLPSSMVVGFDLTELLAVDQPSRISMYGEAIASGILTIDEARALEGWPAPSQPAAPRLTPIRRDAGDAAELSA